MRALKAKAVRWLAALAVAGLALAALAGCGTVGYLAQSVHGHLSLMHAARPVGEWVADPATPAPLRERLLLTQRMRDFAVDELQLPENRSYRRYADLKRGAAVWNVVAAPELSLKLQSACFPVVGCVGYRGYFDRAEADAEAERLRGQGLEVAVYGVPAYSTLGWTDWLGGDPLLNTFIGYPEGELARMLFHELAHQVAYAKDDMPFNESFATAVERIGGERWLSTRADTKAREDYVRYDSRRQEFRALTRRTRDQLDALFKSDLPDAAKRERKAAIMQAMRDEHRRLKAERWGGYAGYDPWFDRANNASLAVVAAYNDLVPRFERLYADHGSDFGRFYREVQRLARLPKAERHAALGAPAP